jgi:hypothetical protein
MTRAEGNDLDAALARCEMLRDRVRELGGRVRQLENGHRTGRSAKRGFAGRAPVGVVATRRKEGLVR